MKLSSKWLFKWNEIFKKNIKKKDTHPQIHSIKQ